MGLYSFEVLDPDPYFDMDAAPGLSEPKNPYPKMLGNAESGFGAGSNIS